MKIFCSRKPSAKSKISWNITYYKIVLIEWLFLNLRATVKKGGYIWAAKKIKISNSILMDHWCTGIGDLSTKQFSHEKEIVPSAVLVKHTTIQTVQNLKWERNSNKLRSMIRPKTLIKRISWELSSDVFQQKDKWSVSCISGF